MLSFAFLSAFSTGAILFTTSELPSLTEVPSSATFTLEDLSAEIVLDVGQGALEPFDICGKSFTLPSKRIGSALILPSNSPKMLVSPHGADLPSLYHSTEPELRPNHSKNSSKWINFEFSLEVRLTRTSVYVDYDNCEAASVSAKPSWSPGWR